jgi:hypothetical protein
MYKEGEQKPIRPGYIHKTTDFNDQFQMLLTNIRHNIQQFFFTKQIQLQIIPFGHMLKSRNADTTSPFINTSFMPTLQPISP